VNLCVGGIQFDFGQWMPEPNFQMGHNLVIIEYMFVIHVWPYKLLSSKSFLTNLLFEYLFSSL
jgi:hypothetical protein